MISYFPLPYPDELLYSLCARYSDYTQYPTKDGVIRDLFGTRSIVAVVDLPSHLNTLIARLPPGQPLTPDELINSTTLFPLYSPFLSNQQRTHCRNDMREDNGTHIHRRLGLLSSSISLSKWLRFCPQCLEQERKVYGEGYWHRLHQVPGVYMCREHRIPLQNSAVIARNSTTQYEFISLERMSNNPGEDLAVPPAWHKPLLQLSEDSQWLLNERGFALEHQALHHWYQAELIRLGFATYSGAMRIRKLIVAFRQVFPRELLAFLQCQIEDTEENWLVRLLRSPQTTQHPLYHLLVVQFLGRSAQDFLEVGNTLHFFGNGPWPCLNPTADHYQQPCVDTCQISYSRQRNNRPIGTFSCGCGFVYTRTGPDQSEENSYSIGKIVCYGAVWEDALRTLWSEEALSLAHIAQQLGVAPLTVKRHAADLNLPFPRPGERPCHLSVRFRHQRWRKDDQFNMNREMHRATWLNTMQKNPGVGVTLLRKEVPQTYYWLWRNDADWLKSHKPLIQCQSQQPTSSIDWRRRDAEFADQVQDVVRRLKNRTGRPIRITKTAIFRELGAMHILGYQLHRLAVTAQAIADANESREAFGVRRVVWAVERFREECTMPTKSQLVRRSGVHQIMSLPQVQQAIDAGLQKLNSWSVGACLGIYTEGSPHHDHMFSNPSSR